MNASFGIDHPLIAVHDIVQLRNRLIAMGFNMTAIGKHPWGTSTSVAMFDGCLIEIMGIYDDSLIDELPAGGFHFGRHVHEHLMQREGVALTALHSTDAQADALYARNTGLVPAGQLEFGREVKLPDGRYDRTRTTLVLLPDGQWPRLSFFLCQQHRPDLIYVPEWLKHPNSVVGISGITILAESDDQEVLLGKYKGLYGSPRRIEGGFCLKTANGSIQLLSSGQAEMALGTLPDEIRADPQPCVIGMDLHYSDVGSLKRHLLASGIAFNHSEGVFSCLDAKDIGNVFFRFMPIASTARTAMSQT